MKTINQGKPGEIHFYELYTAFTDVQLLEVLKNQKSYQKVAVDAAIKIAIERQLIFSEQDLLAPEFQNTIPIRYSFIPRIENDYHRQRLIGSISRFLYVMSLMPVIYGFLKYGEGQLDRPTSELALG